MSKIIMIDDRINEYYLKKAGSIRTYFIENAKVINTPQEKQENADKNITHATVSACILEELTTDYELINLQILKNPVEKGSIEDLVLALNYCQQLEADIICMSLGTVRLSDSIKLIGIINQLTEQGKIIISAVSNQNYITLPASYDQVIGVRCCLNNEIPPGEIRVTTKDPLGSQIYGNCNLKLKNRKIPIQICNSYTVPVVAAYVNDYLNSEQKLSLQSCPSIKIDSRENTEKVIDFLKIRFPLTKLEEPISLIRNPRIPQSLPIVTLVGFTRGWTNIFISKLAETQGVEGVSLEQGANIEQTKEYKEFIEEFLYVDLIFYIVKTNEWNKKIDLFQSDLAIVKSEGVTRFIEGEEIIDTLETWEMDQGKNVEAHIEKLMELMG